MKNELKSIFYQDFPHVEHDGKAPSREEEYARAQLKASIKWDEEKGKYSCGLPYKFGREKTAEILNSVDSSSMAKNRMRSLKRNLEKNPAKKAKAFSEMAKFLDKGRCEKLTREEIARQEEEGLPIWHLPCHIVEQKGKHRFCHDARASAGGVCPNELLIGGLNLMTPMLDPINNLRQYLYAFGTDIEAFFS